MSTKHTKGEMWIGQTEPNGGVELMVGDCYVAKAIVGSPGFAPANARLIVQCWNAHDDLVAALDAVIASRDKNYWEQERFVSANGEAPAYWSPAASMVDSEAIAKARAALAKAHQGAEQ